MATRYPGDIDATPNHGDISVWRRRLCVLSLGAGIQHKPDVALFFPLARACQTGPLLSELLPRLSYPADLRTRVTLVTGSRARPK